MPLTVKEKEHWKQQIEKRIEKAIALAYRSKGQEWQNALKEKAEAKAIKRLGLSNYLEQYSDLDKQQKDLYDKLEKLVEEYEKPYRNSHSYRTHLSGHYLIKQVIEEEASLIEQELLQDSEIGQKILQLQQEKEGLLDTIWLATSPAQIRTLWKDFTTMVTDQPTQLQVKAMNYRPADTE